LYLFLFVQLASATLKSFEKLLLSFSRIDPTLRTNVLIVLIIIQFMTERKFYFRCEIMDTYSIILPSEV
jgi:hypothetical protein